jgi:hypothetical protein
MKQFQSFKEFYPFYLSQHRDPICRGLHFFGTTMALFTLILTVLTHRFLLLVLLPFLGYGPAWIGHFFFEKNRPATFQYPLFSLMGDWVMWKDFILGKFRRSRSS